MQNLFSKRFCILGKMMMKRTLALVLALLCLPLASCSKGLELPEDPMEVETATATKEVDKKTEEKNKTKEETEEGREDPREDSEMNVFFVSNSTCYYFTDELYGLLTAAGYEDVTLALAYYSGCPLEKHYTWLQQDKAGYKLRIVDEKGIDMKPDYSLRRAMNLKNWDVISFDNNNRTFASGDAATAIDISEPYFGKLHAYMKKNFPDARLMWHQVWAAEIGYSGAVEMTTKELRTKIYEAKRDVMHHMMKEYGVEGVPTGDAWEKIRDLPLFTTPISGTGQDRFTLCTRIQKGKIKDDFGHDGDIGGGQYLNACVWFEILTGKSCVGNSFRPKYELDGKDLSLSEEKINLLQKTAHQAVEEFKAI